jgi:hypothetical protein
VGVTRLPDELYGPQPRLQAANVSFIHARGTAAMRHGGLAAR